MLVLRIIIQIKSMKKTITIFGIKKIFLFYLYHLKSYVFIIY